MQIELFEIPVIPSQRLVCGGIYQDKRPDYRDPEAPYAICWGKDGFHWILPEMWAIDEEGEIGCAHNMELVQGYGFAYQPTKNTFCIRNGGRKNEENYIIYKGVFHDGFIESLKPYLRVFHK